jgi:hypothetical protein
MVDMKPAVQCSSEKSVPEEERVDTEKDVEKDMVGTNVADPDIVSQEKSTAPAQASGDRALVLMDLDNGLVGWDSADDPENPQ